MVKQIQKPISRTVHLLNCAPVLNDQRNIMPAYEEARFKNPYRSQAHFMDYYFTKQLNRLPFQKKNPKALPMPPTELKNPLKIGMGPFIALTEMIAAGFLVASLRTISTWINLVTTLGEFFQTWAAGTDSLGDPNDENGENGEKAKSLREACMAHVQVFAGGMGGLGFAWDQIFGEENEMKEVPFWKKIGLSLSSAFNAVFMFFGAAEKTLISGLSKNKKIKELMGKESSNMRINGHNDRRCTLEWSLMTVLPWASNINLFKNAADLLVIYGALREGFDHYLEENKILGICDNLGKMPGLKKAAEYFCNPKLLLTDVYSKLSSNGKKKPEKEQKDEIICFPFNKGLGWFLGTESDKDGPGTNGFRQKYLVPVLKFFGTTPPVCYQDKSGNVVSEFYPGVPDLALEEQIERPSNIEPRMETSFTPEKKVAVSQ